MKKILLIPILAVTLACNALLGEPAAMPTSTPKGDIPTRRPPASATAPQTGELASTATQPTGPRGFAEVRLRSRDGDLPSLLKEESQKAAALGLMPVVEFDATW